MAAVAIGRTPTPALARPPTPGQYLCASNTAKTFARLIARLGASWSAVARQPGVPDRYRIGHRRGVGAIDGQVPNVGCNL